MPFSDTTTRDPGFALYKIKNTAFSTAKYLIELLLHLWGDWVIENVLAWKPELEILARFKGDTHLLLTGSRAGQVTTQMKQVSNSLANQPDL